MTCFHDHIALVVFVFFTHQGPFGALIVAKLLANVSEELCNYRCVQSDLQMWKKRQLLCPLLSLSTGSSKLGIISATPVIDGTNPSSDCFFNDRFIGKAQHSYAVFEQDTIMLQRSHLRKHYRQMEPYLFSVPWYAANMFVRSSNSFSFLSALSRELHLVVF